MQRVVMDKDADWTLRRQKVSQVIDDICQRMGCLGFRGPGILTHQDGDFLCIGLVKPGKPTRCLFAGPRIDIIAIFIYSCRSCTGAVKPSANRSQAASFSRSRPGSSRHWRIRPESAFSKYWYMGAARCTNYRRPFPWNKQLCHNNWRFLEISASSTRKKTV